MRTLLAPMAGALLVALPHAPVQAQHAGREHAAMPAESAPEKARAKRPATRDATQPAAQPVAEKPVAASRAEQAPTSSRPAANPPEAAHGTTRAAQPPAVDHAAMGHGAPASTHEHAAMGHGDGPPAHGHAAMHASPVAQATPSTADHAAMGHGDARVASGAAAEATTSPAMQPAPATVDHAARGHGTPPALHDHAAIGHGDTTSAHDHAGGAHGTSSAHDHAAMGHGDAAAPHDRAAMAHGETPPGHDHAAGGHGTHGGSSAHDHAAKGHGDPAAPHDHAAMIRGDAPATHDPAATGHATDRGLPADAAPRMPIPTLTDADRAAAFPRLAHGHAVHDRRIHSYWLADRLEWQDGDEAAFGWEGLAWIGGDVHRLWLRTEGEAAGGEIEHGDVEVLYGRGMTAWWDVVAGVRRDIGHGPSRTWAAIGVQGLAPYKFEVEATAYVGAGGRTAASLEAEYDTLITNRLILQWQAGASLYGRDDPALRIGSGLSTVEAGARLRYEVTRRFAPYFGLQVERAFGGTADRRRAEGAPTRDTRLVAGLRFWF